jgi:hypothetical protein
MYSIVSVITWPFVDVRRVFFRIHKTCVDIALYRLAHRKCSGVRNCETISEEPLHNFVSKYFYRIILAHFSYFIRNIDLRHNVGFEALTACSPLKFSRCFGGICQLHLQGWRISQDRNQHATGSKQYTCLSYSLTLKMPLLAACLVLVSCFAYSSNPKIE